VSPRAIVTLLQETGAQWYEDRGPRLGAALAFYTLFSLAPILIIVIAIAAMAFGEDAAQAQIIEHIDTLVGPEVARTIQTTLENASRPRSGVIATLIGLATLLFGATIVFSELRDALNLIWRVSPAGERSLLIGLIRDRLLSFAIVFGIGFLLLMSIVANAVLAAMTQIFGGFIAEQVYVLRTVNFLFSFVIVTLLFAMMYKVLPDTNIPWSAVLIGAVATALLFTIGRFLIGLYLMYSGIMSAYGAAGSLVALLMWVYYSAQIFYFGAEFTKVYTTRQGRRAAPPADNVPMMHESQVE